MATLDWSQCPAVESVPGKVSGAWVLRGTRMPVTAIFENLEAGANIVGACCGSTPEHIRAFRSRMDEHFESQRRRSELEHENQTL